MTPEAPGRYPRRPRVPTWLWYAALGALVCVGAFVALVVWCVRSGLADSIHGAAARGDTTQVRRLLAGGVDVNRREWDRRSTALHLAAENGRTEVVRVLLDSGADIEAPDYNGSTPLTYAAGKAQTDAARLLLRRGADPNMANMWGYTGLHAAIAADSQECVELLLAAGADANAVAYFSDNRRRTPLDAAAGHPGIVRILREAGGVSASAVRPQ